MGTLIIFFMLFLANTQNPPSLQTGFISIPAITSFREVSVFSELNFSNVQARQGDPVVGINNKIKENSNNLIYWFLVLFYGQLALIITIWILFSSDLIGIIFGLIILALIIAFTLPGRSRKITVVILAFLNFFMGTGIVLTGIGIDSDPLPPQALISILPLSGLLTWAIIWATGLKFPFLSRKANGTPG